MSKKKVKPVRAWAWLTSQGELEDMAYPSQGQSDMLSLSPGDAVEVMIVPLADYRELKVQAKKGGKGK